MKILVVGRGKLVKNSRPFYMIDFLKKTQNVMVMGFENTTDSQSKIADVNRKRNIFQALWIGGLILLKRWDRLIFTKKHYQLLASLKDREFDLIICYDLVLLPIVIKEKRGAKVLFDVQEFYPRKNPASLRWNLDENFNGELCRKYMMQADKVITTSTSLKMLYQEKYGIDCGVIYSFCPYCELMPSRIENEIKMIYHGLASPIYQVEKTIEIIDHLPDEYHLDLMLVFQDDSYRKRIEKMVIKRQKNGKKIRIIPSLSFEEFVVFNNQYDLGIYAIPALGQNANCTLPNEFFGYLQSRLALAIFPYHEMESFVLKYQNGIVSKEQTPISLAESILSLDRQKMMQMKIKSHIATKILNVTQNDSRVKNLIRELFLMRRH